MRLGESLRRRRKSGRPNPAQWLQGPTGRTAALAGGMAFLGLTLGYLFATRLLFPAPPPPGDLREVPDLRGLDVQEASERILGTDLVPDEIHGFHHPEADSGQVFAQAPLPGQLVRPEAGVELTVSLGAERSIVPDVVGLRRDWAVSLLEAQGFGVEADTVEAPEARGLVVAVDPEPGSGVDLPAQLVLSVSTGPALVAMPSLMGMTEEEAGDTLRALGLEVAEVERVFRFGRNRGVVVSQVPPADSLLAPGTEVRFSVGRR